MASSGAKNQSRTSTTLLRRVQQRDDENAWNDFVDRYAPKLYRWGRARGLSEHDAQDVTQDVLTRLVQGVRTYDSARGSFRSWLKTVWLNALRDAAKGWRRAGRAVGDTAAREFIVNLEARRDLLNRLNDEFDREVLDEAVCRVRARVDDHTWKAFALQQEKGMKIVEIAETINKSEGAVKMGIARVRRMIRQEVQALVANPVA